MEKNIFTLFVCIRVCSKKIRLLCSKMILGPYQNLLMCPWNCKKSKKARQLPVVEKLLGKEVCAKHIGDFKKFLMIQKILMGNDAPCSAG